MPVRGLLLCAAVPVTPEMERSAAQQQHVHHVLRADSLLGHVLGHVAAACRDVGTLTTEDELLPAASVYSGSAEPAAAAAALPDVVRSCSVQAPASGADAAATAAASPPPTGDLHWALRLLRAHFRYSQPPPPPPPQKASRGARRRDWVDRQRPRPDGDRAGSVAGTLRQVGEELRRIADQLQLNRLVGWPTHEQILRDAIARHPVLTGLAGCALLAGTVAAFSRTLRP